MRTPAWLLPVLLSDSCGMESAHPAGASPPQGFAAREMAAHGIAREPIGDTPASQW